MQEAPDSVWRVQILNLSSKEQMLLLRNDAYTAPALLFPPAPDIGHLTRPEQLLWSSKHCSWGSLACYTASVAPLGSTDPCRGAGGGSKIIGSNTISVGQALIPICPFPHGVDGSPSATRQPRWHLQDVRQLSRCSSSH